MKAILVAHKSSCLLREFHKHTASLEEYYTNSKSLSLRQTQKGTTQIPHHERTPCPAVRIVADWPSPAVSSFTIHLRVWDQVTLFSVYSGVATYQFDGSQGHVFLRTLQTMTQQGRAAKDFIISTQDRTSLRGKLCSGIPWQAAEIYNICSTLLPPPFFHRHFSQ